jgi:hypothetical protein
MKEMLVLCLDMYLTEILVLVCYTRDTINDSRMLYMYMYLPEMPVLCYTCIYQISFFRSVALSSLLQRLRILKVGVHLPPLKHTTFFN